MILAQRLRMAGFKPSEPPPVGAMPTLIITDRAQGDDGTDTFQTFDVSSASSGSMSYLASLNMTDIGGRRAKAVAVDTDRNIAIVSVTSDDAVEGSFVYSFDMSDPTDSSSWVISSLNVDPANSNSFNTIDIDKTTNLAYLTTSADATLNCIDISDPNNMTVVGSINVSGGDVSTNNVCIDAQRKILFIGCSEELIVVDISDPANMVETHVYSDPVLAPFGNGIALDTDRNILFVGGGYDGFGYIDVSDLGSMQFVVLYDSDTCMARGLKYDQELQVCIADTEWDSDGLKVQRIDVSDLANPSLTQFSASDEPTGTFIDTVAKIAYVMYADTNYEFIALDYATGLTQVASLITTMQCERAALSAS